jgi:RNA polymerase sigma-70 factor, ECF subfamily
VTRDARFEAEALPHLRRLYAAAYRMTRNAADAEDLVQETLLRAWRGYDRFTPGTNIRAWLYTILGRACTDGRRKDGRSPSTVELPPEGPPVAARQASVGDGVDLDRALASLPEPFRMAVVLRDVEELSYEDIARIENVPMGTVMSRIHRGRALVREALGGRKP